MEFGSNPDGVSFHCYLETGRKRMKNKHFSAIVAQIEEFCARAAKSRHLQWFFYIFVILQKKS
jgi:hypothetical protein